MANPRWAETSVPKYLPDRVAQLYYAHGLLCSSYPYFILSFGFFFVIVCCYPLLHVQLQSNIPQYFSRASFFNPQNDTELDDPPRWFTSDVPFCYIQQIVIRGSVSPWTKKMILTDAIRAPLAESFKLVEVVSNYQDGNSSLAFNDLCLHVEQLKEKSAGSGRVLPEYSCLIFSPANLWQQDIHLFQKDSNLVKTIFNNHDHDRSKISLSEISFGVNMKDTGIKRYALRNRQRIIQFSVTLFLRKYDKRYIEGLSGHLTKLYPLYQELRNPINSTSLHIFYPGEVIYHTHILLVAIYIVVFIFIYYSFRKVELIKSKFCVALSAVMVLLTAFFMTIGICLHFQLDLDRHGLGKEALPYFIIGVGLENILVLTQSIISIPPHLDYKIRIAQGLSKEGWSITKNFFLEVTVLTAGLLTFFPEIQEICLFAVVALICDFFLQMVFFVTILSLDIQSLDPMLNVDTPRTLFQYQNSFHTKMHYKPPSRLSRSRSLSKLMGLNVFSNNPKIIPQEKISKRVKIIHFWARSRIIQRMLMFCMITWIGGIIYNIGMVHMDQSEVETNSKSNKSKQKFQAPLAWNGERRAAILEVEARLQMAEKLAQIKSGKEQEMSNSSSTADDLFRFKQSQYEPWRRLHPQHWLSIFSLYNISLSRSYVSILPPIHLTNIISPERAVVMRNSNEKGFYFQWESLASALDPLDFSELDPKLSNRILGIQSSKPHMFLNAPFIPSSPMELFFTSLLCIISVIVVAYGVYVIYRCVCTKNYAEWRTSWTSSENENNMINTGLQVVLEAIPIPLIGHPQEVECIATDGNIVVTSCLSGEIRSWDAYTGEQLDIINRTKKDLAQKTDLKKVKLKKKESNKLLRDGNQKHMNIFPDLQPIINTKFNKIRYHVENKFYKNDGFDYGDKVKHVYNHFERERACERSNSANDLNRGNLNVNNYVSQNATEKSSDDQEDDNANSSTCQSNEPVVNTTVSNEDGDNSRGVVWCLDCKNNIIALGCSNGHLEFWEVSSCKLKYVYKENSDVGVTLLKLVDMFVVAAKLNGVLDFFNLQFSNSSDQTETSHYSTNKSIRRVHLRTGSVGSLLEFQKGTTLEDETFLNCTKIESTRAHHQPITVLECVGNRVISGSQDHTLKVYKLEDQQLLFSLHGHCGPITALFIDGISMMSGSGSQDGVLCVWDIVTGACMYSIQAHDGCIHALTYSDSYVISLGQDENLCVWDRFQGHLLSTIQLVQNFCSTMAMLSHELLITSRRGSLVIINVRSAETVRIIKLGNADNCVFIHQIIPLSDGIVCDYNNQLRIVRFPIVKDKGQ